MTDRADDQCVRCGPLSDEYSEPTSGQNAGRCTQTAEFEVFQDDPDPERVCYRHLAQTVAAHSPRRPVTVRRFYPRQVVTGAAAAGSWTLPAEGSVGPVKDVSRGVAVYDGQGSRRSRSQVTTGREGEGDR